MGLRFLGELAFYRTYAKTLPNGKKETWEQCVDRYRDMLYKRYPDQKPMIDAACERVYKRQCVPSMRGMQFSGEPVERENARLYNCSVVAIDSIESFGEYIYLLMNGCGVGWSIQTGHIDQLPVVPEPVFYGTYTIPDSREGWADSVKALLRNPAVVFDYSLLRPEGALISTGGTSSGPGVLEEAHHKIGSILIEAVGRKLTAKEIADILCICADMVFVGGVRRAACIGLYSPEDQSMRDYKQGDWWKEHPYRSFVNISAVFDPDTLTERQLGGALDACFDGGSGEPGVALIRKPLEYGLNPCSEITMSYQGFCNLTEVIAPNCRTKGEFVSAVIAATVLGTLQAGFTNFNYLRPIWKENAERDALLGVSITGQAQVWDKLQEWIPAATPCIVPVNESVAAAIGINPSARITAVKPSGTTSAVFGCTSGIHAAHAHFYIRNIRITKTNPVAKEILRVAGNSTLVSDEGDQICVSIPVETPPAIYQADETAVGLLERMKWMRQNWVNPGHVRGDNHHNVSLTCYFGQDEREDIKQWMWDNREFYTGVALFPRTETHYVRAPFQNVSLQDWEAAMSTFRDDFGGLDLANVIWDTPDERQQELACAGGSCELR